MIAAHTFDYVLVGGGLQNGLIALALLHQRPGIRVAIVERQSRLGGNHVWSFFETDVPAGARGIVDPLVRYRWPGYRVRFPSGERRLAVPYASIPSDHFDQTLRNRLGAGALFCGAEATDVRADRVVLQDGSTLHAGVVVDARGPAHPRGPVGFQTFLGAELRFPREHGLSEPTLMDATVDQTDGFRFMYTLPLDARSLLVEDTYFTTSPTLDHARLRDGILRHARLRGLGDPELVREEEGVLPMPWTDDDTPRFVAHGPLAAGYGGGWFHPGTGYSFAVALRLALHVASTAPDQLFGAGLRALVDEHRRQARFCRLLNDLLFRWFAPQDRWHVFARFYQLPVSTIHRFYALRLTTADRFRLVAGAPPRGLSLRARLQTGRV